MIKLEITTKWSKTVITETCKTIATSIQDGCLHITLDSKTSERRGYAQVTSIKVV